MKTLAFVTPWFGEKIPGGAEMALRELVVHLNEEGIKLEVLTTCVKEFSSNWSENYYEEGTSVELGVLVRRFKADKRDEQRFASINYKLMQGLSITLNEEEIFCDEMINSNSLYHYIEETKDQYSLFIFIPYMFGTTYFGCQICPEKSVLIPCLHDESYAYMQCFRKAFSNTAGMIFLAKPEKKLASELYDLSRMKQEVLGMGLDTQIVSSGQEFRQKYKVNSPYIVYAGRKDAGKNVHTLIQYFSEYKKRMDSKLKLVLLGGGNIEIPKVLVEDVVDLGFVDVQDKYNAMEGAEFLCQPSNNESFSLVIMESWLCKRPVLVSGQCAVTKGFVTETQGGLYFDNYFEFEGAVEYLLNHPEIEKQMGENGRNYVLSEFSWEVIVKKYLKFFEEVIEDYKEKGTCDN